jgi:hypothetical protein
MCSFLQPPVTSSLVGSNVLLSTLFTNTLCSTLNVRDQFSHPYRTTGKINCFVYPNFCVFRQQTTRQKVLYWMVTRIARISTHLNIFLNRMLFSYCPSQIFKLCHIFKGSLFLRYNFAFTSIPNSLLVSIRVSVFLYGIYVISSIFTSAT